ncbi:MAG: hypothetical protein IJ161_04540 [Bacteroidales bacterium]|nr:hypothetical protein [Bacteroidales bacterium]
MNIKTLFRFIPACLVFLVSVSCSKDSAQLQNAVSEEDNAVLLRSHLTDEDLVYDSKGLHIGITLQEALKRGISKDEYTSISKSLVELSEAVKAELVTKSEDVVSYGLLTLSTSNQSSGISSTPILFNHTALRVISLFNVPHTYGTSMVCVDVPSTIDIIYYIGSGQINKNYAFNGSSVSLSYAYNQTLTDSETASLVYAIIGIDL